MAGDPNRGRKITSTGIRRVPALCFLGRRRERMPEPGLKPSDATRLRALLLGLVKIS